MMSHPNLFPILAAAIVAAAAGACIQPDDDLETVFQKPGGYVLSSLSISVDPYAEYDIDGPFSDKEPELGVTAFLSESERLVDASAVLYGPGVEPGYEAEWLFSEDPDWNPTVNRHALIHAGQIEFSITNFNFLDVTQTVDHCVLEVTEEMLDRVGDDILTISMRRDSADEKNCINLGDEWRGLFTDRRYKGNLTALDLALEPLP